MKDIEARELANQFGSRMCDENGDTHGEELYCFSLDDIIAIKEALVIPLYTAPPQRPWVGLTDDERTEIWKNCDPTHAGYVTALVEAKLKEKNNG
jgi:hypothetical protein